MSITNDRIKDAVRFARDAFGERRRKAERSLLVLHSLEAAEIVQTITEDEDIIIATVLHDVVEDTDATMDDVRNRFGDRVADLVAADTEDKHPEMPSSESWMMRKEETIRFLQETDNLGAKMLILGDKLSNIRSLSRLKESEGDAMWRHFNQRDPEKHHWYYRSIADAIICLKDTEAWKEYDRLVAFVFEENENITQKN